MNHRWNNKWRRTFHRNMFFKTGNRGWNCQLFVLFRRVFPQSTKNPAQLFFKKWSLIRHCGKRHPYLTHTQFSMNFSKTFEIVSKVAFLREYGYFFGARGVTPLAAECQKIRTSLRHWKSPAATISYKQNGAIQLTQPRHCNTQRHCAMQLGMLNIQ